ncbi:chaperone protein dnaJ 20, chloroplastic-like [Phoenix dactylifera]|uniref:Chaperone protein dnaJ 20, chloroplastic-like n=1 Tax=Phoenix dactylifera TaxID=42345 RepID=A0A8B7C2S3_PHODC|nr:chaperone protein dnaJ 20, chloroplastic-like [Phoenix dactylifera]
MYELLAVAETAGPAEIKAAYRQQARRWHPDACRSTSEKPFFAQQFMRAREAYGVLSDPALRRDYDLSLRAAGASVFGGASVRARAREGFGDWEAQLEGLWRRAARPGREKTWGSRMRSSAVEIETA